MKSTGVKEPIKELRTKAAQSSAGGFRAGCRLKSWLVNLIGTYGIRHVVCIDSSTKQILDGDEKYPMAFSDESIKCCVGDCTAIKKMDIRKLVRKPVSKRKLSSSTVEKKEVKEVEVIEISHDEFEFIHLCD